MTTETAGALGAEQRRQAVDFGVEVLRAEAQAIEQIAERLGEAFVDAVERVLRCSGRVVVSGMGKSGIVGQKISATLSSTGTPSIVLHPAEAIHGDLGSVVAGDVVVAISNSGETAELLALIEPLKRQQVELIALTGRADSTLARHSDGLLDIGRVEEACALKLAPSVSSTAMLALGDALALTVSKLRNFSREDYARFHPGGSLGRQLMTVAELMRSGEQCPVVTEEATVRDLLAAITRARAGAAIVTDAAGRLTGIFTDGDLRRHLADDGELTVPARVVMTADPRVVSAETLVAEAHGLMRQHKIGDLPVVDGNHQPVGLLDIKDLLGL